MPAIDLLTPRAERPILLEVNGGSEFHYVVIFQQLHHLNCFLSVELPSTVRPVMKASAFVDDGRGPSLSNVLSVLKNHGIDVASHQIDVIFMIFFNSFYMTKLYLMPLLCYVVGTFKGSWRPF